MLVFMIINAHPVSNYNQSDVSACRVFGDRSGEGIE